MGSTGKVFISNVGRKLVAARWDPRAATYLAQRISLAIQRGIAAYILATLLRGRHLSEIWRLRFYL